MSDAYYLKRWISTQKALEKLLIEDQAALNMDLIEDRHEAIKIVLPIYYQYRRIVQRLTSCLDQIVQPQIRETLRKMLDYSIVRMLEYRREMVTLAYTECSWPIDYLLEARWTPDDIDLTAPNYNMAARLKEFSRRKQIVEAARSARASAAEVRHSSVGSAKATSLSGSLSHPFADAVLLIQKHERGRVVRRIAIKAEQKHKIDLAMASGYVSPKKIDIAVQIEAANTIKRAWRNYLAWKAKKGKKDYFEQIIGMSIPSLNPNRHIFERYKSVEKAQYELQEKARKHLNDRMEHLKQKIWDVRGPSLVEDIQDELRAWFYEWYHVMRCFDAIPPEEYGGSALIATGQARSAQEYMMNPPSADKKPASKPPEKKEESEEKEEEEGYRMRPSLVIPYLQQINEEYLNTWAARADELENFKGGLLDDLINEQLYYQLQLEMREIADRKMRVQHQIFNKGLTADCAADSIAFTQTVPQTFEGIEPKRKEQPPAKGKHKQRNNHHEEEEPQVLEEKMLVTLARWKVMRFEAWPEEYRLSRWQGAPRVASGPGLDMKLGDLKQPVMDYCVLPIGSKQVHELSPLIRSVCLCGPPGAGQVFLARAVCAELKATVFDLTPEKHVGKFKSRESQNKLVFAINKLAREYAPSVVLVETESAWLKSIPPELKKVNPKRFAPIYKKIINAIKPGDQVLFLTASTKPQLAASTFSKLHDKMLVIPISDYASAAKNYYNSLMRKHGVDRHVELSAVARLTYRDSPLEIVSDVVNRAASIARRMDLKRRPLRPEEIFENWLVGPRPTTDELDAFTTKFFDKLPLEVQRRQVEQEELPPEAKKK